MYQTTDVGTIGEHIAARELQTKGYSTNVDTKSPGSTDIEARSSAASLLVQVKTAVTPNAPSSLSSEEERNIKARASRLGFQAWLAKVQLSPTLQPVGAVQWTRLV